MVNIRIHRPKIRSELTALKDCEPPHTCAMANVRPWVGRTEPEESGIQSICCLKRPVWAPLPSALPRVSAFPNRTHQVAVLLRANPYMPVAPLAELSQFLHLGVHMLLVILHGKTPRVEDAYVTAKAEQDPGALERQKARVRSWLGSNISTLTTSERPRAVWRAARRARTEKDGRSACAGAGKGTAWAASYRLRRLP